VVRALNIGRRSSTVLRRLGDRDQVVVLATLCLILLAGGWLRLSGANWDDGTHLHPDERYISGVANVIHWPHSIAAYFDPQTSPLSPYNTEEGQHYSYGTLPLLATKLTADLFGEGDYGHLYLVGRRLSALVDMVTIGLVFLIGRSLFAGRLRRRADVAGLTAAALYATTVAAVQASHYFTTDSWVVMFGTATFMFALRSVRGDLDRPGRGELAAMLPVATALGLTVASKASGLFTVVPVCIALAGRTHVLAMLTAWRIALIRLVRDALIVIVGAYVAFRATSPYAFGNASWFDVRLSHAFRSALAEQRDILDGKIIFPPTDQWLLSTRLWDPFENLVIWQLGLALGITALLGLALLGLDAGRRVSSANSTGEAVAQTREVMVVVYPLAVFIYMGTRFQHMGRYLLPIMPLLAVAAAYALVAGRRRHRAPRIAAAAVVVLLTGAYALAFHTIYTSPMTRVAASEWLAAHAPAGARIANENWDDSLPTGALAQPYTLITVPVFDPDDRSKIGKLYAALGPADYYVLSSPRASRTIGRLPERFPLMVRFYRDLFSGALGFAPVASYSSSPRLLGIQLDDRGAEEAFWVYDHPPVTIFRHARRLSLEEFRARLCSPPAPDACS
jgi:hypothetical protein